MHKPCSKCGTEKPATLDHFGPCTTVRSGLSAACIPCLRARTRDSNKKHYTKRKAQTDAWLAANPEKVRARKAREYARHRAAIIEKRKAFRAAGGGKRTVAQMKQNGAQKRARYLSATGGFSTADVLAVLVVQGGTCYWCEESIEHGYHVDHIEPISATLDNSVKNICLACAPCNMQKGSKFPVTWLSDPLCRVNRRACAQLP